jgi:hypothetical protein
MATKFDKTLSHDDIERAIQSEFRPDIIEIVLRQNLKTEKYLRETQNRFSSSLSQMKKQFTI